MLASNMMFFHFGLYVLYLWQILVMSLLNVDDLVTGEVSGVSLSDISLLPA